MEPGTRVRGRPVRMALGLAALAGVPVAPPAVQGQTDVSETMAVLPYRLVKNQRLIEVRIRGQGPFTFLVDTGVAGAAVNVGLAKRLGIRLDPAASSVMTGGSADGARVYQTHILELEVGTIYLDSLQAAALPLNNLGARLGEPLHGILGDGFLSTRATRFDPVAGTVSFAATLDAFSADRDSADWIAPLGIDPQGDMPRLEVTLGEHTFFATLDMGSSLGMEVFTPYAVELGLGHAFDEWEQGSVLGGSLGRATTYDGTVPRVTIGPLTLENVPTSITPPRASANRKGNLGNALWEDFVIILDYPADRMLFRRVR